VRKRFSEGNRHSQTSLDFLKCYPYVIHMAYIVRRRGSRTWTAFFRIGGKQFCRSTKQKDRRLAQTIADGWEGLREKRLSQIRKVAGELAELVTGSKLENTTVTTHCNDWLAIKKGEIAVASYDHYQASVSKFLAHLGAKAQQPVSEVTKADIVAFRNELAKTLRAKTCNHHLKCLRQIFKAAQRDALISEDPTRFVDTLKVKDTAKRRGFTAEEIAKVLAVAEPQWQSLIRFGLYTGGRLADLARLTFSDIDQKRGQLRLKVSKTGKEVLLPIAAPLKAHIESLPVPISNELPIHAEAFAIVAREKRSGSLSNQFTELLVKAGLREAKDHKRHGAGRSAKRVANELSFHSLRHSTVSFLHEAGLPQATVEAFVGHDSSAVNRLYTHVGMGELTRAAAALSEKCAI
jgi:integrase